MAKQEQKSCPSHTCTTGATILGVFNNQAKVVFNTIEVKVDEEMAEEFHQEFGEPEKHFRFSGTCVESGCNQWKNNQCSVINTIVKLNAHQALGNELPNCLIRETCRWFFQHGESACSCCAYIVTDSEYTSQSNEFRD